MDYSVFELIWDYVDSDLFPPSKNWPEEEFKKRSYARFVAFDILKAIVVDHGLCDPIDIVERYLTRANCMMCEAQTISQELLMKTIVETAQDILHLLKEAKNE